MLSLSEEQIVALAPDPASVKAGMGLAGIGNWEGLAVGDSAIWGMCKGSGKMPYKTQIDLQVLATKCSCPSRKFPCKHGLALLLLYDRQKDLFLSTKPPDWVQAWLQSRRERQALLTVENLKEDTTSASQKAAEKRSKARHNKVSSGLEGLRLWFLDVSREGLLTYLEKPSPYWMDLSKRMIDAQCPGVAARFQAIAMRSFQHAQNKEALLIRQLAHIHLLVEAWPNIDTLPEAYQAEVRTQIGFPVAKEEVLGQAGLDDQWLVLGCETSMQQKLTVQSYWFWGMETQRFGLFLQYIAPGQIAAETFAPGTSITGTWTYYPGIHPVRGLFKQMERTDAWPSPSYAQSLSAASAKVAEVFAANPFLDRVPIWVSGVHVVFEAEQLLLVGEEGVAVRINNTEDQRWLILAISGGTNFDAFCLVGESGWAVASICLQDDFFPIIS